MARTQGAKGKKKYSDPVKKYNNLNYVDQWVCFDYWNYLQAGGSEGLGPSKAGYKEHYHSSSFYEENISQHSWYSKGKVSFRAQRAAGARRPRQISLTGKLF